MPNDLGSDQTEQVWRKNLNYHFYYVGESYPVPGATQDPEKNDFIRGYDSEALKFGEIDGVSRIPIPSDFTTSGILTNGSVNFNLTRSGTTYNVTVDTDAYDYILYPYPASDSIFDNRHTIPDTYNVDLPIPTLVINGDREKAGAGGAIPSFHVPRMDTAGAANLYFENEPKPQKVFPIVFTYDTDLKSYADKDGSGIDLRGLLTSFDPILDKVGVLSWGVTGYDVPGLYLPNILTIERSTGDIAGNDYLIKFPRDCKPETDPGTTAWNLLDDTLVQQVFGPGADTLAGQRIGLDTNALHRYGKLPPVYVSSLYPSNALSTDEKNMFFIDTIPVKSDNPGVIIDDAIGGNYGIRLEGLDGNPYRALAVDPLGIIYCGKGNKLNDSFQPALAGPDPARLVALRGIAEDVYSVSYKDSKGNWTDKHVYNSKPGDSVLAYWDITGLCGMYTVRLVSQKGENFNVSLKEVYIGNRVAQSQDSTILESAGGQAKIIFPASSITDEKIITIDAVTLDEVKDIAVLPDIAPVGKIVKFGPHGESFEALPDYLKPQVHFIYHKSELDTINPFELAIWHLTDSGRLEAIPTIKVVHRIDDAGNDTVIWSSDTDPQAQFPTNYTYLAAYGSVPYFSYYLVLEGNRLESPVIDENDFTTNKTFANVSGTGTPGMGLKTFVTGSPFFDPHAQPPVSTGDGHVRPDSGFFVSNIPLPYEGYNFIYIGYESALASEYSKLVVTRDTTPPVIQMAPYNEYISPNNDGIQDSIDLAVTSSETGRITVEVLDSLSGALVYEKEVACLETVPVTLQIKGIDTEGFTLRDGTYSIRVKAFDALENCTVRDGNPLVIDTRAPRASIVSYQGLISPANRDGAFDVLSIELELSENATVSAWIGNFADPSQRKLLQNMRLDAGITTFFWDGKDDWGNYVPDGSYFFRIRAYDESGNLTEISFPDKRTIVDNTPPLVTLAAKDMQVFTVPGPLSIGFTASEESTVTVSLQDSENRILFSNTGIHKRGSNTVIFDAGEDIADGFYVLATAAIDAVLNTAPQASKTIEISHDR
jgi:hypothetical protein